MGDDWVGRVPMAVLFAIVAVACGSDEAANGADGSAPDAASADAAACASNELRFEMTLHAGYSTSDPVLPDVHTCVLDRPELGCADSDGAGTWALCLPASTDLALTLEHPGYLATIFPITTPPSLPLPPHHAEGVMIDDANAGPPWVSMGVAYPPTDQALVWVRTHGEGAGGFLPPNLGNVSGTFSPTAAQGPFYQGTDGSYDPNATATNDDQPDLFAAGLVEDGSQEVVLDHPTLSSCAHLDGGWAGTQPSSVRIPARAGFRTTALVVCRN
jgi:hypothetical protein